MLLYNAVFYVVILYLVPSKSQEANSQITNKSSTHKQTFNVLDPEYPDSDLWLISRDDPIPLKLHGRWSFGNADSQIQLVNLDQFRGDTGLQTSNSDTDNLPISTQQTQSLLSEIPVLNYHRTLTSEDRRQNIGRSDIVPIQNPGAVLIQLPPDVTEGLWVRQDSTDFLQLPIDSRQNIPTENRSFQNENSNDGNNSNLRTVHLPIQDVFSRLSNTEQPQSRLNSPTGQFHPVPLQASAAATQDSVNTSTTEVSWDRNFGQEFIILRQPENYPTSSIDESRHYVDGSESFTSASGQQSYGNVLTGEDIELLERLGILSALMLDPKNTSNNGEVFEKDYDKPLSINNGGQVELLSPYEKNNRNLSDVVLIDVPDFISPDYDSAISEDVGIHTNSQRLLPYLFLQPQNTTWKNESNESEKPQNSYKLIDSQLVEFLNLLGLNSEELMNQSTVVTPRKDLNISNQNDTRKNGNSSLVSVLENHNKLAGKYDDTFNNKEHATASTATVSISSTLNNDSTYKSLKRDELVEPSVSNGRIQPRFLEKPVLIENEIIQRLKDTAIPISEKKLEMVKKLQIPRQPYVFGFKQHDGNGTFQHRNETSDSKGVVKGSYSYKDHDGVYRVVYYAADGNGFHAVVKTNEPGTVSHSTADAVFMSETPPLAALLKMRNYLKHKLPLNVTEKS